MKIQASSQACCLDYLAALASLALCLLLRLLWLLLQFLLLSSCSSSACTSSAVSFYSRSSCNARCLTRFPFRDSTGFDKYAPVETGSLFVKNPASSSGPPPGSLRGTMLELCWCHSGAMLELKRWPLEPDEHTKVKLWLGRCAMLSITIGTYIENV